MPHSSTKSEVVFIDSTSVYQAMHNVLEEVQDIVESFQNSHSSAEIDDSVVRTVVREAECARKASRIQDPDLPGMSWEVDHLRTFEEGSRVREDSGKEEQEEEGGGGTTV